jgi:hypothetical protein
LPLLLLPLLLLLLLLLLLPLLLPPPLLPAAVLPIASCQRSNGGAATWRRRLGVLVRRGRGCPGEPRVSLRSLSALGRAPHRLAVAVAVGVVAPQRSPAAFCRSCAGVVPTNDGVAMSGRNRVRAARAHLLRPHRRFGQLGLTHGSAVL